MKNNKGQTNLHLVLVGSVVLLVMLILLGAFYTVSAGYRGVLLTFGKADQYPIGEGIHMKIPMVQGVIWMEVRTQKYEADASASSSDLQVVTAKIATNYHLSPDSVVAIYNDIGLDYTTRIIMPLEQEAVKSVTAKYTAEELITKREQVRQDIKTLMIERLLPRGIIVEEVSIVNFDFSPTFNTAIENKVTQEQNALAAKNKLEQIKFEAQQQVEAAKGQAESITIISQSLQANPSILKLKAIEKWDGKMPMVTGGAMPFVDISGLTGNIEVPLTQQANLIK
jgi:regulator of protease activity HflC (stomatin/prohibitin superfamily)